MLIRREKYITYACKEALVPSPSIVTLTRSGKPVSQRLTFHPPVTKWQNPQQILKYHVTRGSCRLHTVNTQTTHWVQIHAEPMLQVHHLILCWRGGASLGGGEADYGPCLVQVEREQM